MGPGLFSGVALRGAGLSQPSMPILAPRRASRFEGGGEGVMTGMAAEPLQALPPHNLPVSPIPARADTLFPPATLPPPIFAPARLVAEHATERVVMGRPRDPALSQPATPRPSSPALQLIVPTPEPREAPEPQTVMPAAIAEPALPVPPPAIVLAVTAPDPVRAPEPPAAHALPIPTAIRSPPVAVTHEPPSPSVSVTIARLELIFDAPPLAAPAPRPAAPDRARGFQAYDRARRGMPR